ncbi:unnamed protein product [Cylicocyclus nassatus]|uniref:Uncharacterized protein n=1 Tax=Cylicocyclus nassatus TaxID=53992 RepID=A0AA36H5A7_CYLNA|nr:unnamed protein product [Cylicocyclus nassatus]
MSLKSVFQRRDRNYNSDSSGYYSSSDISSALSGSQFILRPATVQSAWSKEPLYHTLEYDHYPISSNYTSPSSTSLSLSENDTFGEDDESTLRPRSNLTLRSLKPSAQSKIAACKTVFSSLAVRTRRRRPSVLNFDSPEEPQNIEDFLDFEEKASEKARNDEVSIEELFNALRMQDDFLPTKDGTASVASTIRRKQISIKEPDDSSKIYFNYHTKKRLPLPFIKRSSKPRSILKKEPSLSFTHLYEEIDGDHLSPLPDDVRPVVPTRPDVQPMRIFPPCNDFQPRKMEKCRSSTLKRRQKIPTLHHAEQESAAPSWSSRLKQKLFSKSSPDVRE